MSKKDKKILITISAIILLIFMSVILAFVVSKAYMTNSVRTFLSEKYGADKSEFELVDFKRSSYYIDGDPLPNIGKTYTKWEFKYHGRNFFVNEIDGKYYDDFQLEDVEKWCVEWLKENVDNRIIAVTINSYNLFIFEEECYKKNESYALSGSNIDLFLEHYQIYNNYNYYKSNDYGFHKHIDFKCVFNDETATDTESAIVADEILKKYKNELPASSVSEMISDKYYNISIIFNKDSNMWTKSYSLNRK